MTSKPPSILLGAGTYQGRGGDGLRSVCLTADGRWSLGEVYAGAPNASFSVRSARHGLHYVVDEREAGAIGVHRHDSRGWTVLASISTGGTFPCHLVLDPAETLLAVANYGSGSVSLIRLGGHDGLPRGPVQVHANRGSGPDAQRQEGPHAHWVGFSPDGRWLYQTDLGTDEVFAFPLDAHGNLGIPAVAHAAPPGSGPRHLLLHPRLGHRCYLASELVSTLTVLDRADCGLANPRIVSTLPEGWRGDSIVAHVAVNRAGDRLYVSNRGHNSIAVFSLDADGLPTLLQHAPAGGESPRFFMLLEERGLIVVANERSQTLTSLSIGEDGRLSPTGLSLPIAGAAYVMRIDPPEPRLVG